MSENPTVATVAATLRMAAGYARTTPDALIALAEEIESDWDGASCPLCEREACDDACPLRDVRDRQPDHEMPDDMAEIYRRIDQLSATANSMRKRR